MRESETPNAQIERLLASGGFTQALHLCDAMIKLSPRNRMALVGRARANLGLGRTCDADGDLDRALRIDPADAQSNLLRGMVDQRLGRIDAAVERLTKLAASSSPYNIEAAVTLAETLYFSHRRDELKNFVQAGGAWMREARGALFTARVRAREDPQGAIDELLQIVRSEKSVVLRRVAGFDAVQLLDKVGRFREAYELAVQLHAQTTPPFDLEGMVGAISEQRTRFAAAGRWITPRADPVRGVSMVVGLPRCGSTLLEQMLDSHPAISGIGEFDGVEMLADALASTGCTLRDLPRVSRETAQELQLQYVQNATRLRRVGAQWTFDKTLEAWQHLPILAAVMPGTVFFHVERDPRDMAISMLLSFFHPISNGWTASLESVRRVIEAERSILPAALESLEFAHEQIVYEDLVADPIGHAKRCLDRLSLAMDERVVQPERNTRAVFTLSHEQVRNPINSASIGRWRNYEWAFDAAWDSLAAAHDARRITK